MITVITTRPIQKVKKEKRNCQIKQKRENPSERVRLELADRAENGRK